MTIVEAIKEVFSRHNEGLTSQEVYEYIVHYNLYQFGAQQPTAVVNNQIRRRCIGLEFPTAFPNKLFEIVGYKNKKPVFSLIGKVKNTDTINRQNSRSTIDILPEEKLVISYHEHIAALKEQLIGIILENPPDFFERMVMDLLLKIGYGYGKSAGTVTGHSHDGGIDGIISEDKLGLDLIYIQAKRYSKSNKVGRKDLQAFVGAMQHIKKGVFITSSSFTQEAIDFANKQQQKSLKLINGDYLADLLIKYEIGIDRVQSFAIYKIDTDYYE